jgi:hypothetical protein
LGKNFARWAIVYFGQFFYKFKSMAISLASFFHDTSMNNFDLKIGWATFWAIFPHRIWSPCSRKI